MSEKTNRLTIYLIKPEYTRFDQIVEDNATAHQIDGVGTFYMEDSRPHAPDWLEDFFGNALAKKLKLISSSAKGLLLVRRKDGQSRRIFALSFGYGRSLLRDGVIEDRFGLKVVINAVDPNSLRSIDKTTLGSVPKQSREQMSREGVAANFGIDVEQDLINAVTGRSFDKKMGRTISGRDALGVSVKIDVDDISEFLGVCLKHYQSDAYKKDFAWIDQIQDIRDPVLIARLDKLLIDKIKARQFEKLWMAVPEIVDWVDVKGFRYLRPKRGDLVADLQIDEVVELLSGKEITVELLKGCSIYAISAKTDDEFAHWSAYRCIYGEIELNGTVYVLNGAKWYQIAGDFVVEVNRDFNAIPDSTLALPNYAHADEAAYNAALPGVVPNSHCMDRKMITYGGGHSSIEYCDLATADKKLVHIKRYSGSSQLSHLFAQGVVSAELLVQDAKFREKVNAELPAPLRFANAAERPNANEYEVVFAIISKSANPLEIPFFSKVSLRNAFRRLRGYNYAVSKKKIAKQ